jgi:hypothetical protein
MTDRNDGQAKWTNAPRPYDLADPTEIERWFREMEGYARIFVRAGTDDKGRQYAMDALPGIRAMLAERGKA